MNREHARFVMTWALVLFCPSAAFAQASIAGVVRDTSQAVLPGVTVEASSPALIEKVRSVVTDATGQYRIVDLRPGTYTVTFMLPGFAIVKREGVEVTGSGTFQVNAELRVGALEETITVTGETPVVDVQNVKTQSVLTDDVIAALPSARNYESLHILVPGVTLAAGSQDVGGSSTNSLVFFTAHGGQNHDSRVLVNGVSIADVQSNGGRSMWVPSTASSQEITITTSSGGLGESETAGVVVNMLYKEGGNTFSGIVFGSAATEGMASTNYDQALRDRGLRAPNNVKDVFDWEATFGGPFIKDKLWFFAQARYHGFNNYIAGLFHNKNAGDITKWTYEPDFSRQAVADASWKNASLRLTWQATPRNKFSAFHDDELRCAPCTTSAGVFGISINSTPEATGRQTSHPDNFTQLTWTSPVTNRLLLEAGGGGHVLRYGGAKPFPGDPPFNPDLVRVQEQGGFFPGISYRAVLNTAKPWIGNYGYRASLSYATGTHSLKFGLNGDFHNFTQRQDSATHIQYRFRNGVPNQLTQFAHPFEYWEQLHQRGLYAQDQWTVKRLTLSGGLRYDKFTAYFPEGRVGPTRFVPVQLVVPAEETVNLNDITVRGSAVYDLFGNGKTAFKISLGKYMIAQNSHSQVLGGQSAPMNRVSTSTSRSWTDANRNFVPDCDLLSPLANGECGPWDNQSFGRQRIVTRLDPAITHGWGVRPYNWVFDVGVQRELIPRVSANVTYFRRWFGNFAVIDNLALTPADYTFFDLPLPADPRLPISGVVSGFFDVVPEKFGVFNNFVTAAKNYGKMTQNWDGVDVSLNARLQDVTVQGGVSTGRLARNVCDVAAKAPTVLLAAYESAGIGTGGQSIPMQYCDMKGAIQTQVKFLGAYTVPRIDVQVAATLQNIPGQEIQARYVASNAVVAPLLGRDLSGRAANSTLNLLPPLAYYSDRVNQLDVRFAKILRIGGRPRLQVTFDLYNALNSNVVQTYNPNYLPTGAWRIPLAILPARLSKVTAQLDF